MCITPQYHLWSYLSKDPKKSLLPSSGLTLQSLAGGSTCGVTGVTLRWRCQPSGSENTMLGEVSGFWVCVLATGTWAFCCRTGRM